MSAQTPTSQLSYVVLNVFTREKYKGNPLPVVITEHDLAIADYRKVAREFGYPETSFIYYSRMHGALQVRSFTPIGVEVNGAGHHLLGAVCLTVLRGWDIFKGQPDGKWVRMKDQFIALRIDVDTPDLPLVSMLQQGIEIGKEVPAHPIAAALNLDPAHIGAKGWVPTIVKTEVAHLMVPVKNQTCLQSIIPNKRLLSKISRDSGFEGYYCFTLAQPEDNVLVQSRFFNPGIGIEEDAATGSAAGPLGAFLHAKGIVQRDQTYAILQGVEMGQPSTIQFRVSGEGVWIMGSAVILMEGTLNL